MTTQCLILRTNRTMARKNVKDSSDDFIFEEGTYFIRKEKVFLWKTSIRGKIKPTLLYIEGISDPLYLDNLKLKEHIENIPLLDEKNNPILDEKGKQKFTKKIIKTLEDIFIDSRAIHNMTDKKLLIDLSAQPSISSMDIITLILLIAIIGLCIAKFFIH